MPRLGVGQMTANDDKERNYRAVVRLVSEAVQLEVDFLALPECFAFMGAKEGESVAAGESLDGDLMDRYCRLARENRLWISFGGFHEAGAKGGRVFNTHVIVDDSGCIRATYRKCHLFDVETPDGGSFLESRSTAAGDELMICENTPIGAVGMTICYDLRFPEVFSQLRKAGAHVLLVPSAFMPVTGRAHWDVLLRARAIETQCYVGAAAQCGTHSSHRSSYGHAQIVDPWGTVVANAGADAECVVVADVDAAFVDSVRQRMPVASHRREDLYARGARGSVF